MAPDQVENTLSEPAHHAANAKDLKDVTRTSRLNSCQLNRYFQTSCVLLNQVITSINNILYFYINLMDCSILKTEFLERVWEM